MHLVRDIQPLTDFKRETSRFIQQLKDTGEPVVLTVNGKPELVVQDAVSYQELLDIRERWETLLDIKEGTASIERGEGVPAEEAFDLLFKKYGLAGEQ